MKVLLITIFLALPCFVFAQVKEDDYAIYSNYLKTLQKDTSGKITYVIRVSGDYEGKKGQSYISDIVSDLRDYLKGTKSYGLAFVKFRLFRDTIKKDTLWVPIMAQLSQEMKKRYYIKNSFSKDLQVDLLTYPLYAGFFEQKDAQDVWPAFHEYYPGDSRLIELSQVVSDGKRAAFFFSEGCGGLCGGASLILYYKDSSGWRFAGEFPLWYH